jgi:zinc finger protein
MNFTLIVDDCLGSSYLQNLYAPDPDPNMTIEEYERTWEQNEAFGLNDMCENPEEAAVEKEGEKETTKDKESNESA